jgi:hypothetical protein
LLFSKKFSGGNSEGDTPVPIPNTAVKPLSADGTILVTVWESRTLPGFILKALLDIQVRLFYFKPTIDRTVNLFRNKL